jgi:hypothetical protein
MTTKLLSPFKTSDGLIAVVDVLGVSDMPTERREVLYESLAQFGSEFAKNYFQANGKEFPVNETNALMVGDALCFAQSSGGKGSQLFVVHSAITLSRFLFASGFPHRGYITRGSYRADHPDRGLPFIVGQGVVDVFKNESKMKIVGIGAGMEAMKTIPGFRGEIGNLYWTKSQNFGPDGFHMISSDLHFSHWKKFCDEKYQSHPYVASAKAIVDQGLLWEK